MLRIGVSVGAQKVVQLGEDEKLEVVVRSEEFKNAIEMVMEEAKDRR